MTTHTKRRGRRSLAAILAAMLMASVLAVVAASPAQAANTSYEVLIDTNSDGVPDAREFAGQDRYDTALRLAKNFAQAKGGLGAVPAAFISSGQTLVDSISVAGLAGYVDAPILLTPSNNLHGGAADFIEDYGVSTVYVLGGVAAVSDAVVTAIEGLTAKPKVVRIAGDDRYATAARIASMIDTQSSWCGSTAAGAVLINGATDMMSFGVAVQTTAFRLQLPVLMTAADELSSATADFIRDNDIEHVQIVGGTGAVSADVASALTSLGVDTVARVEGDTASAVSVELAKMAGNGCSDSLGLVSSTMVALVRGNPDGVVAAPVLASSLANGFLVTPLVVGDSLPSVVSDYLAATPKNDGANKLNLGIVAVGGTAAVTAATMSAATTAAASAGSLTVSIAGGDDPATTAAGEDEGDTNKDGTANADDPVRPGAFISLYFSDDVPAAGAAGTTENDALLARVRDVIEVNGVPAQVTAVSTTAAAGSCLDRRVNVVLGTALRAGDTVSVAQSTHNFGTANDERTVAPASATVQAAPADTARPRISIVGIADASTATTSFNVSFSDNVGLGANTQLTDAEVTVIAGPGGTAVPNPTVTHTAGTATATVDLGSGRDLVVGDRLVINPGAIEDSASPTPNRSAGVSGTAIKAQASPRITSVLMSNLKHSANNTWTVPGANPFAAPLASSGAAVLTISARGSGDAAGAAGNDWQILLDTAQGYMPAKPLDIDVRVDPTGKRAAIRWVNGAATVGDLLAALRANSDFDERFSTSLNPCSAPLSTPLVHTAASRDVLAVSSGVGRTQFALEVRFNAYIATVNHTALLTDVLGAAASRSGQSIADIRAAAADVDPDTAGSGAGLGLTSPATITPPVTMVRYEATTSRVANLPMARDLVETAAGSAVSTPTVTEVATGYAADDTTATPTNVDENKNAASQLRIAVSGSVKVPS